MAMNYAYGDLYPSFATNVTDMTSLAANPEKEDQEALNENGDVSDMADNKQSRSFTILIAIGLILLFVIFLGAK